MCASITAGGGRCSCRLTHPPGHGQADFGEARAVIGGVARKAHFFVFDLPHSDACYVRAYPAATAEAWIDGHVHAFAFFGGVPQSVLYDNDRCLVSRILADGTRRRARLFNGFLSHYLVRDRYGRPGKGNDKGAVEGLVGFSRRNFMVPLPRFAGWEAFNLRLEEQCSAAARAISCAGTERPSESAWCGIWRPWPRRRRRPSRPAPGSRTGQLAVSGPLRDQRLLGAGGLWPSRRLGARLRRPGGDRLRRRGHRPPSRSYEREDTIFEPIQLSAPDRAEDRRAGSGGAARRMGAAARVPDPAPPDGGALGPGGAAGVCAGPAAAGELRAGGSPWRREGRSAPGRRRLRRGQASGAVPGREAPAEARPRRLPVPAEGRRRQDLSATSYMCLLSEDAA